MRQLFIQKTRGYFEYYSRIGRRYSPASFEYFQDDIVFGACLSRLNLAGIGVKVDNRCRGIMVIPR